MNITQKLKQIQKYSGKTQEELARDLGVSFPTLNSWINDKSLPRERSIQKIDSLYIEIFGDTSISQDQLETKTEKLELLRQQFPNPFSRIISRQDIYDSFLLSLTYHTNSIEGSTMTEPDVRSVLFDGVTVPNKSVLEHQEAKNHQAALGYVMKWIQEKNDKIDKNFVRNLHQILMNGIISNAGVFRDHSVRMVETNVTTSNYLKIPRDMEDFLDSFNQLPPSTLEQVNLIARSHARFEQIHPFSDGNGRLGRLLMLIQAFRYRFAPVLIRRERKQAYYTYLEESQTRNNHVPLTSFIFDSLFEGYKLLSD